MKNSVSGLLLLLVFVGVAAAQENPVLPDLAPREVEITGDLTISFPSLRRQPLIGFNPPPRVPDIPASRRPYTAAYKQPSADLPPSPLRPPEPPPVSTMANRQPVKGMVEAGIGRYFDRYVNADLAADFGSRTSLLFRGVYGGTSGYSPFSADPNIKTSSNREFTELGLRTRMSGSIVGLDAGASRSAYSLYGAVPSPRDLSLKNPSRTVSNVYSELWIESQAASSVSGKFTVGVGRAAIDTDVFDPAIRIDPATERTEKRLTLDGNIRFPFSEGSIQADVDGSLMGLDESGFPGNTITAASAGLTYRFEPTDRIRTSVGVRASGFEAAGQTPSGGDRSLVYLSPDVLIEYSLAPGIDIYVGDRPGLQTASITDVYRLNPYLMDEAVLQPVLTSTHLLAGLKASGDRIHASFQVGWKDVKNYRYAESSPSVVRGYTKGYPILNYEEASILYAKTQITGVLSPGIQASVRAAYRDGHLDDSDSDIPYFSPFTYGVSVSVGLFEGLFQLRIAASGESARFIDRAETVEIGPLLRLETEASYFLTEQAGITVGVRNLGSRREFWDNYTPEGSVFYTGARWRW